MQKGRPRKKETEKLTDSILLRLNSQDYEILKKIALYRKLSLSSLVMTELSSKKYLDDKISDEKYEELLMYPEMMQTVSQRIVKNDVHIIRCWITREDKKSLTYTAVIRNRCSVSILVNKTIVGLIRNKSN
jgi:hypothetical protein